jgi:hypothetical protein
MAERRYSWDAIAPHMIQTYRALIARESSESTHIVGAELARPEQRKVLRQIEYEHS